MSGPPPTTPAVQGARYEASDANQFLCVLRAAIDYRGDVTLHRRDGATITGYLYDGAELDDPASARVRILPDDGSERLTVAVADLRALEFSGRDTALGRSFDTWVKKWVKDKYGVDVT